MMSSEREEKSRSSGEESSKGEADMKDWSDLPMDIVRLIFERLRFIDRIRVKRVCKAWSIADREKRIPSIHKLPWAMNLKWHPIPAGPIYGECVMIDPPVCESHIARQGLRQCDLQSARPRASSYGWVLFQLDSAISQLILYSPFTNELIKLPNTTQGFNVTTFSLDATSPRCVIFGMWMDDDDNIFINLCSPDVDSWEIIECKTPVGCGFSNAYPVHAAYGGGFFYCLFSKGQLGAFRIESREWTILTPHDMIHGFDFYIIHGFNFSSAILIVSTESEGDIQLMAIAAADSSTKQLFRFNFSESRWDRVGDNDLNNHVLLIGCTSFSCPAVGEARELANHILPCPDIDYYPCLKCHIGNGTTSDSLEYRSWLRTVSDSMLWIEFPLYPWTAKDLIKDKATRTTKHPTTV